MIIFKYKEKMILIIFKYKERMILIISKYKNRMILIIRKGHSSLYWLLLWNGSSLWESENVCKKEKLQGIILMRLALSAIGCIQTVT